MAPFNPIEVPYSLNLKLQLTQLELFLCLRYKNSETTAKMPASIIKSHWVLSTNLVMVPKSAAPPIQIANELIQQQLVPTTKTIILAIEVFLYHFIYFDLIAVIEILLTLDAISFASSLSTLKFISFAIFAMCGSANINSKGKFAFELITISEKPAFLTY